MTDEKLSALSEQIAALENLLYSDHFPYTDSSRTVLDPTFKSRIDLTSMAQYYLVFEIMYNTEIEWPKSCFFTFDTSENLLKAGPVWDFDWAAYTTDEDIVCNSFLYFDALFRTQEFNDEVKLLTQRLSEQAIRNRITCLSDEISDAVGYDSIRWGFSPRNPLGPSQSSWSGYVSHLQSCVLTRLNVLKSTFSN